jgi:hypothetical protein
VAKKVVEIFYNISWKLKLKVDELRYLAEEISKQCVQGIT